MQGQNGGHVEAPVSWRGGRFGGAKLCGSLRPLLLWAGI